MSTPCCARVHSACVCSRVPRLPVANPRRATQRPIRYEVGMPAKNTRTEHDLLGDFDVPTDAYYGVQTARALENFKITGQEIRTFPNFIRGLAMVKLAAARANFETGGFSREI